MDKFIASIYPLKHYSYLVSPFIIFRRIWDAYDNLGKCQYKCLGRIIIESNCVMLLFQRYIFTTMHVGIVLGAVLSISGANNHYCSYIKLIYFNVFALSAAAINECDTGAADCATDATCIETPGGFECRCDEGFEGDGTTECTPAAELGKLQ